MKDVKLFIQGFIIGIGKIIPGVSGAMFAMMFGVYEKALDIICNLKTKLFKNFKFMMILGSSIMLAIIFGSNIIKSSLDKYYLQTMFLFIGMMTAGIKPLFKNVKGENLSLKNFICAGTICIALILLDCIDLGVTEASLTKTPSTVILLFISGFLDAMATIIPGICGTALLMILGYYNIVIHSLSDIFNFNNLTNNLFVLIPFGIGLIIGAILVSKLVNYLFKNYRTQTYYTIIGFAISSTIILFVNAITSSFTLPQLFISIMLFIVGFLISYFFDKLKI